MFTSMQRRASILIAVLLLVAAALFTLDGGMWTIYGGMAALDGIVLILLRTRAFAPVTHTPGVAEAVTKPTGGARLPSRVTRRPEPLPVLVLPDQVHLPPDEVVHWSGIATLKEDTTYGRTVDASERVVHTITQVALRERGRGQLLLTNRRLLLLHGAAPQQILLSSIVAADATWQAVSLLLRDSAHRLLICVDQPQALADLLGRVQREGRSAAPMADDPPWAPGTVVPFTEARHGETVNLETPRAQ